QFRNICIETIYIGTKKYLSVHLKYEIDHGLMSIYLAFLKINLFSHNPPKKSRASLWKGPNGTESYLGFGDNFFISFDDLLDSSNEFVVNDSIMISIDYIAFP
ncbi:hypothetical protein PFISCL1PPCAC_24724, partial [Pristionchus fissidentatus]